ncbi:putative ribonuclease H-like domain-containing protein [Tanacetum coccineum]
MNEFCEQKGIKRKYSIARTPQQNGVAERRNRTLIEAARTMLADSKLPTTFWAEAVNTVCYVQNRNHLASSMENLILRGEGGILCLLLLTSKAYRVYNIRTRRVEENLHIRFLEDKPIISGDGPKWLFDLDSLTKSMNYVPVIAGTNSNDFAGSEVSISEGPTSKETDTSQDYIVMPLWKYSSLFDSSSMNVSHDEPEASSDAEKRDDEGVSKATKVDDQERPESNTPNINTVRPSVNTTSANPRTGSLHINIVSPIVILLLEEPKRVTKALSDSSWVEAMQEELLQFKLQEVWVLVDLPKGKGPLDILKECKDMKNVCPVARIKPIRLLKRRLYESATRFEDQTILTRGKEDHTVYQEAKEDKYVTDILKKFGFQDVRTASTPKDTEKPLLKDSNSDDVDVHIYRFQVTPKVSHSHAVKRIFRYLKGQPKLGLWYPRNSPFDLVAYSDIQKQLYMPPSSIEAEYVAVASFLWKSTPGFQKSNAGQWHVKRGWDTKIPQSSGPPVKVVMEARHKDLVDRMERAATTASSLEAKQDSGNINRTQSMATLNEPNP